MIYVQDGQHPAYSGWIQSYDLSALHLTASGTQKNLNPMSFEKVGSLSLRAWASKAMNIFTELTLRLRTKKDNKARLADHGSNNHILM